MQRWHPLPAAVYSLVEQTPGSVLLETAPEGQGTSRLFLSPLQVLTPRNAAELRAMLARIDEAVSEGQLAAGYFTYECGSCFESAVPALIGEADRPLAWFGIYAHCHEFDHRLGKFAGAGPAELSGCAGTDALAASESTGLADLTYGLAEAQYWKKIEAIHEWIRRGDVYQLNFTFPLCFPLHSNVAVLYQTLRSRQPVEYGAFVHGEPGRHVLSFSPELFFRIEEQGGERQIVTRPMKGTARRGRTNAEDASIAEWLRGDAKNRSENVMIVDLLRNDLGRLCEYGSVHAEDLFRVERLDTLWQMTSTVKGTLRHDVTSEDLLRALFPCGSVTGAPKVRAMQLIAELETEPRGVYTGAIGYFSKARSAFNVAIRTLEVEDGRAKMGVGSGVVIDSDADAEYRECCLKAEFLTRTTPEFELIETMLWSDGYPLLELHLDRLQDSARYFGFACDRAAVSSALAEAARDFSAGADYKVRLLLDRSGALQIDTDALTTANGSENAPVRVCLSRERAHANDRFYFHKTTNRPLYGHAFQNARAAGFDEVLFLNEEGQVTEGAISNVFIEHGGRWSTPPIACGLLAGVFRRHLLETRPEIEERVLTPEDVKAADAVYITNAVRGLRRAVIDWDFYV